MRNRLNVLIYYPGLSDTYRDLVSKSAEDLNLLVCHSEEDIEQHIGRADVLFVATKFPTRFLEQAANLKWVQTMGAGVENFTLHGSVSPDVILTRVNSGFGEKIAEYVIAYMLAVTQRIAEVLRNQRAKRWLPQQLLWLNEQTLGIVGIGSIGREIAEKASGLGICVIGYDNFPVNLPCLEACYGPGELYEFLAQPKFVVLSLPLTKNTQGMFGLSEFQAMRPDAYLINVARGGLVQQPELIAALQEGLIEGAILDVFDEEPLPADSSLWEMKDVYVTPHQGGPSLPEEMTAFFLENLQRFRSGQDMIGTVDLELGF